MLTFSNGFQVNSEHGTAKTSNAKGTRFMTLPQIGMSSVPQVRVGIVGHAMRLVGNHTHFHAICTCNCQIALGIALYNYLTVIGTKILK